MLAVGTARRVVRQHGDVAQALEQHPLLHEPGAREIDQDPLALGRGQVREPLSAGAQNGGAEHPVVEQ
ncbi:hypothetical protein [Tsukamurella sp. PLM1]|uniref:hypothetical protein n=1 Tax=Tsukamurella sp. PLM1 TaxID=2929795 RepID=UPI0020BD6A5C|nr:hypothetical protein [Tsukamurella sp. PLM1]